MSDRQSPLERMRQELDEMNPARLVRQTSISLSKVAAHGRAATAALEMDARRNLGILAGVGVVTTFLNPLAAGWLASGHDWFNLAGIAVLTFPVFWLQPLLAALGAAGIGAAAIWSSAFSRLTRPWARVTQAAAIVTAIASVGLVLVGIGCLVAIVLMMLVMALIVGVLFALLAGS